MSYAVLHAHDTFGSIGDSILKIPDYVKKAKQLGISSLAITNHGSMATFISFYEECKANNIKPIIGCEVYFCDDICYHGRDGKNNSHLILLAKNLDGLKNLITLHNYAHSEGMYYKPRIDWPVLEKYHDNIICLTACIASPVAKCVFDKDKDKLELVVTRLKGIFGDDLYLEVQPGSFEQQVEYNEVLSFLSNVYKIKLVATNDIHYLNKEDYIAHDIHIKDVRKIETEDLVYPDKVYYLMGKDELTNSFAVTDKFGLNTVKLAVENTNEVAAKCNVSIPEISVMPQYSRYFDEYMVLEYLCTSRLARFFDSAKYDIDRSVYINRLAYELSTIKQLGFSGYFLIVKDIVDYCDNHDIARGPGRGSAAGSLISFLLNISIADPIKYGLMFERFLSVNRKSIPDIDLDIDGEKKDKVYKHLKDRYGENHCCLIRTYGMRKSKAAVKAAARIIGISPQKSNEISELVPTTIYDKQGNKHPDSTVLEALDLVAAFKEEAVKYPNLIETAVKMEGYPFSAGIHPAGVVISPLSIDKLYPLVPCKNDYFMATSLDLHDVEKLSGVKFDLLSLSSLSVIDKTIKMTGIKFDYTDEELLSDKKVWQLIGSSNTTGLFQISSNVYKSRMPKLKPHSIQELAACLALVRGPCISSGADQKYIDILSGKSNPEQLHPIYWNATKDTHGIVIYQEQILKICINIGFDSETAYNILKAVSKKKMDKIKAYKNDFILFGRKQNIDDSVIEKIWAEIENSGLYAFNIAHATSYALLCYLSAYLMTYHPVEYLANLFTKTYCNTKTNMGTVLKDIINVCRKRKIKVLPPDITSKWEFSVQDNCIKAGFCSVKGIGEACYKEIERNHKYSVIDNFVKHSSGKKINKRNMLILIAAGIFGDNIKDMTDKYITIRKEKDFDGIVKINPTTSFNILKDSVKKINKDIYTVSLFG